MIKNIVLDIGKVLIEWDPEAAMRKLGFDELTVAEVASATTKSPDWLVSDRSVLSPEDMLAKFISNNPAYEKEIRTFWENIHLPAEQYAYTRPWLKAMKAKGYGVYILSNYAYWTYLHTQEALSFLEDADGALFSFEDHLLKPEPEIYLTLCERFGLKPEECIFLDDHQENADGAKAVGMEAICFTTYDEAMKLLNDYGVEL
ncbi:MAG: HAD family phosphatase [Roseburia sp.]|nr:HAD family phosphatase [Roseburia sp.]